MTKFLSKFFIPILILTLGLFLRTHSLTSLAPFDWDQNRDYLEVSKIVSGKPTLIGPVARGEGGFFLGPLYYYLLTPLYLITGGNPISLPITSVLIDSLTIALILVLGYSLKNVSFGYIFALLYTVSPSVIDASRISWNVIMVPLWFITIMYYLNKSKYSNLELFLGGVLAASTWHIHAALIPLAPLLMLAKARSLSLFTPRILFIVAGYLLPLSPLVLFDIRHVGLQSNLIKQMVMGQESVRQPILEVAHSALSRYGKNLAMFFGGKSDLNTIVGILGLSLSILMLFSKNMMLRLASFSIIANLCLVIILGIASFPEYYLLTATIATVLIISALLSQSHLGTIFSLVLALYLLSKINFAPSPYGLENKLKLARRIAQETSEASIIYDLPFGRDSGIPLLVKRQGVNTHDSSKNVFMISEKIDSNLFIRGELATELGYYGAFRLVKHKLE
ncbi:MAG: hypothetical protein E6R05_00920 [Candidatus Moraniibacteriota bacterium]|nr:MAG: hypothetical protein E6R05_00920 [Candidatus Moranbacteria bacterium]